MHDYLFRSKKLKKNNQKERKFQIIDYFCKDEEDDSGQKKYVIHLFGVTSKGYSVHLKVNAFTPYFFIKVPDYCNQLHERKLLNFIKDNVYSDHKESILNVSIVTRKDYYGFNNERNYKFACITLKSKSTLYAVKKLFFKPVKIYGINSIAHRFKLYESNIEPFLRFLHVRNINASGWVSVDTYNYIDESRCQIDIETNWKNVNPYDSDKTAPIITASFDIECISGDGSFPQPERFDDKIIQIGTTVYIQGKDNEKQVLKHIITLDTCDDIDGTIIESYDTEEEVILAWMKFIQQLDPDIITGYNIFGFDFEYMYKRAQLLSIDDEFTQCGRLYSENSYLERKKLSSSALGDNFLKILVMQGRLLIDLYKVIQRDYKFTSYKLDNVTSQFIQNSVLECKNNIIYTKKVDGIKENDYISFINYKTKAKLKVNNKYKFKIKTIIDNEIHLEEDIKLDEDLSALKWCQAKDDVTPNEIFQFQKKDSKHRAIIAKYCIQDCVLCNRLMDKLDILTNNIGMSNVCSVPMSYLFLRGQGIKAYSLVAKQCRIDGYLIPEVIKSKTMQEDSDYQGATVLEAHSGEYFCPVSCNDFASLYPSSIISHNLSPDTLVINPKYDHLEDKEYHNIESNGTTYRFVLPEKSGEEASKKGRGIIPRILIYLLNSRKSVKKQMKTETDPFKKSLLDGLQLAYKLTCNSIYGQLGAPTSPIYCKAIAECTTAVGRELLKFSRDKALELFPGTKCVYGDSVTEDTPLLLKNILTGETIIKPICELSNNWHKSRGKQFATCNFEVWTENGWSKIKTVIRHKVEKPIYRVCTLNGIVDVTEDHSLLNEYAKEITPKDCKIGTKLLTSFPEMKNNDFCLPPTYTTNKLEAAKLYYEYKTKTKNVSLGYDIDTNRYYIYTHLNNTNKSCISQIINLGNTKQYVYDLTTENHHFQAGIGELIVHNTDSIFLKYPLSKDITDKTDPNQKAILIQESIDKAKVVEKEISALLPWPHNLEYEKTYFPYILYSKKRYSGIMYEDNPYKISKIDNKGIALKRRDNSPIVKHVFGGALDIILYKQNVELAKTFVRNCMMDLFKGKYDLNYFVVTKTLKITKTTPAHRVLADRIAKREPGNAPQINERIPYVYIYINKKKEKEIIKGYLEDRKDLLQGDRIEHPDYIRKHNLKVDYKFYVTNQIMKPVSELFAIFVKNKSDKEKDKIVYKDLFEDEIRKETNKRNGQLSLLSFLKK